MSLAGEIITEYEYPAKQSLKPTPEESIDVLIYKKVPEQIDTVPEQAPPSPPKTQWLPQTLIEESIQFQESLKNQPKGNERLEKISETLSSIKKRLFTEYPTDTITLKDFQPRNSWIGPKDADYIYDALTDKPYLNEDKWCIRLKCTALTIGTPLIHCIAATTNIFYRIYKIGCHLSKARFTDAGIDLARLVASLFAPVALELAAIYGLFNPLDGRKLYASIERATYNGFNLAPCFQPNPRHHLFGSGISTKNGW